MGLDMYLSLNKRTWNSSVRDKAERLYPTEIEEFEDAIKEHNFASITTTKTYQIGYWRKANAIHHWFVENCGDGEDRCQTMRVSLEDLNRLYGDVLAVLENHNKAKDILPTTEGFFFGSQEYNKWYFEDLEYTKELLEKTISFLEKDEEDWFVTYDASW